MSKASNKRYKLQQAIGSGDFATVYLANDLKLGRDVAIKKIHPHFLADEEKLARYWQEAKLLGSLEHPNIMTIYDVVASHGSLVVELMQGSLKQLYAGRPMPVQEVRQAILQASNGLQYLHQNGIIHGDIKPGNLLLSRQNLVKLGDFGLARRASDSDGSLLKGAAKYMAPELVSDQFGPVEPRSDLYSLGFTALELMCGPDYDSLFPELHAFGRDQQMAWMMWHCSNDRQLPPIGSMLDGVPDDLAAVVQKLTTKDPNQRYQHAGEVIEDLNNGGPAVSIGTGLHEDAIAEEDARKLKRKRRLTALGMFLTSLAVCAAILFLPMKGKEPPPAPPKPRPLQGVVQNIFPMHDKFVIDLTGDPSTFDPSTGDPSTDMDSSDVDSSATAEPSEPSTTDSGAVDSNDANTATNTVSTALPDDDKGWREITLYEEDRVFLNQKERQLRDLQIGDRVVIRKIPSGEDKTYQEVKAFRPEMRRGTIGMVNAGAGKVTLAVNSGQDGGAELPLLVRTVIPITINERDTFADSKITLGDLQIGDRAEIKFIEEETGTSALSIDALRIVSAKGIVRDVDLSQKKMTFVTESNEHITLPIADGCEVSLNGMRFLNEQLLKAKDVQPGDRVDVQYDTRITQVDCSRMFGESGTVTRIDFEARTLSIRPKTDEENTNETSSFVVPDAAEIRLGSETVKLADLRRGDFVQLEHDAPGESTPEILSVAATRPPNPKKWAIFIVNQNYDDKSLTRLPHPLKDVKLLRDRMTQRYAIPEEQAVVLADETRVRLEQSFPEVISRVPDDAELYVFLMTHAYTHTVESPSTSAPSTGASVKSVYLAMRDFALSRTPETGVKLDWVIDQLEDSWTTRKLLLLDCCHAGDGPDLSKQPATASMLDIVRKQHEGGYPERTYVLASCDEGQRSMTTSDSHGLFAKILAEAFAGAADSGRDNQIEFSELSSFVENRTAQLAAEIPNVKTSALPTPKFFLPDDTPPRLTAEAKDAIGAILSQMSRRKVDSTRIRLQAEAADILANGEPEALLAGGLLSLKANDRSQAIELLDQVRLAHPDTITAWQLLAWTYFDMRNYTAGQNTLQGMVNRIKPPPSGASSDLVADAEFTDKQLELFQWVGSLRELADLGDWSRRQPAPATGTAIDTAVQKSGEAAFASYEKGRANTRALSKKFDLDILQNPGQTSEIGLRRRRLTLYATITPEQIAQEIRAMLSN